MSRLDLENAHKEMIDAGHLQSGSPPKFVDIPMVSSYDYLGVLLSLKEVSITRPAPEQDEKLHILDMMPHIQKRCGMAD